MKVRTIISLIAVNLIYACESIFTKLASMQEAMSPAYLACIAGALAILGIYAIAWQQILKKVPVSDAYMFKGCSLVFVLIISAIFFGEHITLCNIFGSAMIASGIVLFAKS